MNVYVSVWFDDEFFGASKNRHGVYIFLIQSPMFAFVHSLHRIHSIRLVEFSLFLLAQLLLRCSNLIIHELYVVVFFLLYFGWLFISSSVSSRLTSSQLVWQIIRFSLLFAAENIRTKSYSNVSRRNTFGYELLVNFVNIITHDLTVGSIC